MTEQMAIEEIIEYERYLSKQPEICNEDFMKCEEHGLIAEWLEELKQYRAIGTVKEIKIKQAEMAVLSKRYLADLGELMEYQKIGTVEELKELEEKSVPKKPKDKGKFADLHVGLCSVCGEGVNSQMNYCDKCGTRLDWE